MKRRPNLLAGEDLPPAPVQQRSLEKRERLKTAALAVFGKLGFERASIEEIAERAHLAVGGFYQHFRSKRQLLLVLMDDLLEHLGRLEFRPASAVDPRTALHQMLASAFATDLRHLGAYRAWQEAALSDRGLARKQRGIQAWTTARVTAVFESLSGLPGARAGVDIPSLARAMDSFFWNLLGQAVTMRRPELNSWIDSATHLIFHALFTDPPRDGRAR